jgi:hypothetical protein
MIEIQNVQEVKKGSLLATCDVYIRPWHLFMHEVKIFQKGNNRWLGLPAREVSNEVGEKKYVELITFDSDAVKTRFRNQIMKHIEDHLEKNPDLTPQDLIKEFDEVPF